MSYREDTDTAYQLVSEKLPNFNILHLRNRLNNAIGQPAVYGMVESLKPLSRCLNQDCFQRWGKLARESLGQVVHPSGTAYHIWQTALVVPLLYNLIIIITRSVFGEFQRMYFTWWMFLDYTSDLMYALDIGIQFRKGYLDQGLLVQNSYLLSKHYVKSTGFKIDILSLFPTDILYAVVGVHVPAVRMNRILRTYKLNEYFEKAIMKTNYPNTYRVFQLVVIILTIIHWNACIYYSLSGWIGFGSDTWVYPSLNISENNCLSRKYLHSFYWSTLTLSTIGDTPTPVTEVELIFVIINFLIGVLIFATIVGNAGAIIADVSNERATFHQKMDDVKRYMKFQNIQPELENTVIQWFDYLWCNKKGFQKESAIGMLPENLKADIAAQVHMSALEKVELFQCCEPNLLKDLVLRLKLQIFSPADYICRKGDVGKEMFIIKNGQVTVTDENNRILATLGPGKVFGEISILDIAGLTTKNQRTANVQAIGYSDIFILSKSDLEDVLNDYPLARTKLIEVGTDILRKENRISEAIPIPTGSNADPLSTKVEALEQSIGELNAFLKFFQAEIKEINNRVSTIEHHCFHNRNKETKPGTAIRSDLPATSGKKVKRQK